MHWRTVTAKEVSSQSITCPFMLADCYRWPKNLQNVFVTMFDWYTMLLGRELSSDGSCVGFWRVGVNHGNALMIMANLLA